MSDSSRIILLTGATRGLGRALTDEFVGRGHVVWGCGRTPEKVEELKQHHPAPHDWSVVDVSDADAVDRWASRLLASGRVPDLLVNNAAMINAPAQLWEVPRAEFDRLVDINIKGVMNVTRAFFPAMLKAGRGVVVNFSSGWGRSVSAEVAPYCMSKWAIEGLSQAMAEEVPKGIAVVPLNPGVIDTAMLRTCWGEGAGHYPEPREWAQRAAPFILKLRASDNGRSLSV